MPRNRKYRDSPHEVAAKGPALDIQGVHLEWDGDEKLRERMREGKSILEEGTDKIVDIQVCVKHQEYLIPLLARMAHLPGKILPSVEDLRNEMVKFLEVNKRMVDSDVKMIVDSAAHVKKLCGFVKTKARREEPSRATQLHAICKTYQDILKYTKISYQNLVYQMHASVHIWTRVM